MTQANTLLPNNMKGLLMIVQVRLFATFRQGRFKKQQLELTDRSHMTDLLEQIDIPAQEVGILLVNGRDSSLDCKLSENDQVSIFPTLGGG